MWKGKKIHILWQEAKRSVTPKSQVRHSERAPDLPSEP